MNHSLPVQICATSNLEKLEHTHPLHHGLRGLLFLLVYDYPPSPHHRRSLNANRSRHDWMAGNADLVLAHGHGHVRDRRGTQAHLKL